MAKSAMNGVIFIDEAYDLDPKRDSAGKDIVRELLVIHILDEKQVLIPYYCIWINVQFQLSFKKVFAEKHRTDLTFILAGYEHEMNENLFSSNPGLESRFDHFQFDNFDVNQLMEMWKTELDKKGFTFDSKAPVVVRERLKKLMQKKNFANGREVRNLVNISFTFRIVFGLPIRQGT